MGPAAGHALPLPQPPTSTLPPLRQLASATDAQLLAALDNLFAIYYPSSSPALPAESALLLCDESAKQPFKLSTRFAPLTDSGYNSGYTSENDDEDEDGNDDGGEDDGDDVLEQLRADELERTFATRWLTRFIAFVEAEEDEEMPPCFATEEARQTLLERAADLLSELLNPTKQDLHEGNEPQDAEEDDRFCRDFTFALPGCDDGSHKDHAPITIHVNDGLAGKSGEDHLDVGLQTWGASIVLCQMMCDDAARFGLSKSQLGEKPKIVELGAGTGLVSLVLGRLLARLRVERPVVVATDYHPAVIANLAENIALNYGSVSGREDDGIVQACALDWADTKMPEAWPLGGHKADVIFATDVVYAAEHAKMLYDCASRLLGPEGVFWLLATVRRNGRFNGVDSTVESVFDDEGRPASPDETGRTLTILESEHLQKRSGVGRGDETFYKLFRIGWR